MNRQPKRVMNLPEVQRIKQRATVEAINAAPQNPPSDQPLTFAEARVAAHNLADKRRDLVTQLKEAAQGAAEAESEYHRAKATAMSMLTSDPNIGITEAQERVKGEVAAELFNRNRAQDEVMILRERLASLDGERASLHRLMEWSQRLNLEDQ